MNSPARRAGRLLRWYPRAWRERYGAEFAALLEQSLIDEPRSCRRTAGLATARTRARLEERDVLARSRRPVDRAATGGALVLTGLIGMMLSAASAVAAGQAAIGRMPPLRVPAAPAGMLAHGRSSTWCFAGACAATVYAGWWYWQSFLFGGLATYWHASAGTEAEVGTAVALMVLSALLVVAGAARTLFRGPSSARLLCPDRRGSKMVK